MEVIMRRNTKSLIAIVALATALAAGQAQATTVFAVDSSPTDLGLFNAGTYGITGSGEVDLVGPVGSGFDILPDGHPATTVTFPGYSYFNPNGSTKPTEISAPEDRVY
jgi:hypothetical protein